MKIYKSVFEIFDSSDDECELIYGGEIDLSDITVNLDHNNRIDIEVHEVTSDALILKTQYGGEIGPLAIKKLSQVHKFKLATMTLRLLFCGLTFIFGSILVILYSFGKISDSRFVYGVAGQVFILSACITALSGELDLFKYIKVMIGAIGKLLGSKEDSKDEENDKTH